MTRLHAKALAIALAAAIPAWGQTPATSDQVLTLTKDGKPFQFKILKTYKHSSGGTAYDVQDPASGEILTVVEDATPEQVRTTLKPDVVSEQKSDLPNKTVPNALPAIKATGAKPPSPTVTRPAPSSQFTRPPVPAVKRWFGWLQKDAKTATPPPNTRPASSSSSIVEAAYHPDPMYRLVGTLSDDLLPSMREVAAGELAAMSRKRPEAIAALIHCACHDPAPSVRLCCIRHLGSLRVRTPECVAALMTLRSDRHPGVSAEAGVILAQLQRP